MKKFIFTVIFLMLISSVFAQEDSSIYYVNLSIDKIYSTNQGYIVFYRTQKGIEAIGVPTRWFNQSAGKAAVINLAVGGDWPSMSVFFRDGEFTNVRLYVHRNKTHYTWGSVPLGTDISSYFPEEDTFDIKF